MIDKLKNFPITLKNECSRKRAFGLIVLFLAIVGFVNAFRFGAASLDYYFVRNAVSGWQSEQKIQTKEQYEQTKESILSAKMLHQSNPLYIDLSGQINEWGAVSGFEQQDSLQQAELNYLQGREMRPLWPVAWANLAMIKWRLQEFDPEMLDYLKQADKLGSQKVEVHILFARLGISLHQTGNRMYPLIKDMVSEHIRLGLRKEQAKPSILAYIESTNSLDLVCQWMFERDRYTADQHLGCL